jgi:hypothetical protein
MSLASWDHFVVPNNSTSILIRVGRAVVFQAVGKDDRCTTFSDTIHLCRGADHGFSRRVRQTGEKTRSTAANICIKTEATYTNPHVV